ncbi:MAG: hypothetical protein P8R54_21625 [Myxococcota bacterium]|nr:hypothetical protein [Myxococcota bacterium]
MDPQDIRVDSELEAVSYVLTGKTTLTSTLKQLFMMQWRAEVLFGFITCSMLLGYLDIEVWGIALSVPLVAALYLYEKNKQRRSPDQLKADPNGFLIDLDTGDRITRVLFEEVEQLTVHPLGDGTCDLSIGRFDDDSLLLGLRLEETTMAWLRDRLASHWADWRTRMTLAGYDITEAVQPPPEVEALQSLMRQPATSDVKSSSS